MPIRCVMSLILTAIWAGSLSAEERFKLENGLQVILVPEKDQPAAVVALGVRAGVYNEPAGRCGLAHLAEHLFWYGATKSYPENRGFDALAREGPLGIAFQDVNAETMWNLTYFYAARP